MLLRQTRLFRDGQGFTAFNHANGRRAPLTSVRRRKACGCEAWNMHSLKFEPLASVYSHKADRINMKRTRGDLTQIPLFCQQDKLAHPIKHSLYRKAGAGWTPVADEI